MFGPLAVVVTLSGNGSYREAFAARPGRRQSKESLINDGVCEHSYLQSFDVCKVTRLTVMRKFGLAPHYVRRTQSISVSGGRNRSAGEVQVGKRQQREHLGGVLCQAAIAHFAIAELAFHHTEHMFDLRAHLAEPAIAGALPGIHRKTLPIRM